MIDLTPKELVRRSVAMARMEKHLARRKRGAERAQHEESVIHCMKLARHIKRAALIYRSYY